MFLTCATDLEGIKHVCITCMLLQALGWLWGLIGEKDVIFTPKEVVVGGGDTEEAGNGNNHKPGDSGVC